MPISDELRAKITGARDLLEEERRPSGTRAIINYLRVEKPLTLLPSEQEAIWDAGWRSVVGSIVRGIATEGGARTVFSTPGEDGGRSYKQLSFVFLVDALGILQSFESSARAYRIQVRGWWEIVSTLRQRPEGSSVADLFPSEERWDVFWQAIRDSDLWNEAA